MVGCHNVHLEVLARWRYGAFSRAGETFRRALAQLVYKFRRNPFDCLWEFCRPK